MLLLGPRSSSRSLACPTQPAHPSYPHPLTFQISKAGRSLSLQGTKFLLNYYALACAPNSGPLTTLGARAGPSPLKGPGPSKPLNRIEQEHALPHRSWLKPLRSGNTKQKQSVAGSLLSRPAPGFGAGGPKEAAPGGPRASPQNISLGTRLILVLAFFSLGL